MAAGSGAGSVTHDTPFHSASARLNYLLFLLINFLGRHSAFLRSQMDQFILLATCLPLVEIYTI